jgi:hypothetical protein
MIIGVEGLSAAEIGLLRTILKLSTQLAVDWTLSEEGPCHVLLTALPATPARAKARVVVPIVRRGENPGGEFLERPFRAEDFVALLGRVAPAARIDTGLERQGETPPPAYVGHRGRLKRWPPSYLIGASRERIQLATFLSRQSRSAQELSALAGYPESTCGAFMLELEKHDLLSWDIPGQREHPRKAAPTPPVRLVPARAMARPACSAAYGAAWA